MSALRYGAIRCVLGAIAASGADRLFAPRTRGLGCILTFHRVSRDAPPVMAENAGLDITPQFLDAVLGELRRLGYEIIALDDLPARLAAGSGAPFAVLTFDDGYRDLVSEALPVLKAHRAPFTAFICTGFADRQAPLWWLDLEAVIERAEVLDVALPEASLYAPARTPGEKAAALRRLYWRLRAMDEAGFRRVLEGLMAAHGVEPGRRVEKLCMDWSQIRTLASEPLATIGAHSVTHPRLGAMPRDEAEREMRLSRAIIAEHLGFAPQHFCYPVGDAAAAGPREAEIARALGFVTAVTARANVLWSGADLLHLPRISVNGLFQRPAYLRALVSGLPFAFGPSVPRPDAAPAGQWLSGQAPA